MLEFSKDDIDHWREELTSWGCPKREARLDNKEVDFFVVPREKFRSIPNGLFRMTGLAKDGYVIGVSDEVPGLIQPHFAVSEHDEFMVYGLGDLDRTLHSEQNMLRILDGDSGLKPLYVDNKLILYSYMLRVSKKDLENWGFTQKDYDGFVRAAEFLRGEQR